VSSTNKTGRYYITEILLEVALNTIILTLRSRGPQKGGLDLLKSFILQYVCN
jgi:hypothetical protein